MDNKLTLVFKNKRKKDKWIGWYLDGGGEQQAEFYAVNWDRQEFHLDYQPEEKQQGGAANAN